MATVGQPWMWLALNAFVVVMLAIDLIVFQHKGHQIRVREAALWSIVWVVMALLFGAGIYFYFGGDQGRRLALEFLSGYIVEKSLSVDNLFVFLVIMSAFAVPQTQQRRVLLWGVLGALVLRITFILAGAALIQRFAWLLYIFGAILLWTGGKLLFVKEDDEPDVKDNRLLKLLRKLVPITHDYREHHFFVRENGKLYATPLLAVLVVIESSDVIFAVDSIPAVFGITNDPFIVYTSNVFAIMGLRALFFLVAGIMGSLRYLKHGLAFILIFIGVKMLIVEWVHVPIEISLSVIGGVLAIVVAASLLRKKPKPSEEKSTEGVGV